MTTAPAAPANDRSQRLLHAVQRAAPHLAISALQEHARGWSFAVYVSPEGYGVRTPLSPEKAAAAAWSAPLLRRVTSLVPFAVPVPLAEVPWVHGSASVFRWIEGVTRTRLGPVNAAAVGQALRRLHDVPIDSLAQEFEPTPWSEQAAGWREALREEVLPLLSSAAASQWEAALEEAEVGAQEYGRDVLLHGDLELDEILWEGSTLVGLTDWDNWLLGDPAWDFRHFTRDCNSAELGALAAAYQAPPMLLTRAKAYATLIPLEDALSALRGEYEAHRREAMQALESPPVSG